MAKNKIEIQNFNINYTYLKEYKLLHLTNCINLLNKYNITPKQLHNKILPNPPLENYSLYELIVGVIGVGCNIPSDLLIDRINYVKEHT